MAYTQSAATLLTGKWTYRSFLNDPTEVTSDPNKAAEKLLALLFAEAVFTFEIPTPTTLKGAIDWPGGGLNLHGTMRDEAGAPVVSITGTGRPHTDTAHWEYDYHGQLAHHWPDGVNQQPALVGNVIRAKPHNGAPAGVVASFIAVKQA
jgi:hypothetical protein